jgi:ABC-type lipopolysaccharide export system ATPase subunit
MRSAVLIFERTPSLEHLAKDYVHVGDVDLQSEMRLVVFCGAEHFSLNKERDGHDLMNQFEPEESEFIRAVTTSPCFVLLEFTSEQVANLAIVDMKPQGQVLVDNDHGLLCTLDEIRRRVRLHESWCMATS